MNTRLTPGLSFYAFLKIFAGSRLGGFFFAFFAYLLTRAPAPPMMASTSLTLAMEVSPGVVMARAP